MASDEAGRAGRVRSRGRLAFARPWRHEVQGPLKVKVEKLDGMSNAFEFDDVVDDRYTDY